MPPTRPIALRIIHRPFSEALPHLRSLRSRTSRSPPQPRHYTCQSHQHKAIFYHPRHYIPRQRPRQPLHLNRDLSTTSHLSAQSTTSPITEPTPLSTDDYHALSDAYIDTLVSQLEQLQEEREDVDVEYSAGVMTLTFPPAGTYVLNKQPPNKQIWLSSPVSGPKRYDWVAGKTGGGEAPEGGLGEGVEGEWVYLRDGSTLSGLLEEEVGIRIEDVEVES